MKRSLCICLCCLIGTTFSHKYELSICAIFQNEAPWLKEWIEYHQLVGIEHFYLYNDHSSDAYSEVLRPYIEAGIAELTNSDMTGYKAQLSSYTHYLKHKGQEAKWTAFIDIDEFLVPMDAETVVEVLRDFEDCPALVVHWVEFGAARIDSLQSEELLIERAMRCSAYDNPWHVWLKCIVQPAQTERVVNCHRFNYKDQRLAVNTVWEPVSGAKSKNIVFDRLRINHYWGRSREWLYGEKLGRLLRRRKWNTREKAEAWIEMHLEQADFQEDTAIQRFVPALKERIFGKGEGQ